MQWIDAAANMAAAIVGGAVFYMVAIHIGIDAVLALTTAGFVAGRIYARLEYNR